MNIDKLPYYLYFAVMAVVVIGWLALIVFPRSRWANFWFSGLIVPQVLCLVYMYLLLTFWFRDPPANLLQFITLTGVADMFRNQGLLLVAWINIIAMDLVVGAWMARKAAQIRMPYLYLLPCLVLTFVFAGFGFTLFAIVAAIGGGWSEIARFEGQPPTNTAPAAARPGAAAHPA
jgi:hypothetical protein